MKIDFVLRKSLNKNKIIRLILNHPDNDYYDGIVLEDSNDFIIFAVMDDFEFNGLIVISKKFIVDFRDGRFEKCDNEVIRFNGQINKMKAPNWLLGCSSWMEIFCFLKKKDIWPSIEILFNKNKASDFFIGPVIGGNEQEVCIRSYDAAGKWEKQFIVSHDEILKICLNDRYNRNFNKFMSTKL